MQDNLLLFAFFTIYALVYREATKTAIGWGAFQFHDPKLIRTKLLPYSLTLLILMPLIFYVPSANIVRSLRLNARDAPSLILDVVLATPLIILLGLFPRAGKHAWNLVALRHISKGTNKGEPGEGWVNRSKDPLRDLPRACYSWQVIIACGILPIVAVAYYYVFRGVSITFADQWKRLFEAAYVAQLIVLYNRASGLRYFRRDDRPTFLLNSRMACTFPLTVLVPISFGLACYPWLLWLEEDARGCCKFVGVMGLLVALAFPYYCNQVVWIYGSAQESVRRPQGLGILGGCGG